MPSDRSTSMRRAALGTALVFTASGALLGTWVSRVPAVVARHDLSPGELGRALLALGIGSLLSMPLTGHACKRVGTRTWVAFTAAVAAVALSCMGLATGPAKLTAALFALGMVYGSWDVAMNIQGSAVDQRAGREWMPRYHACWSLGSIIGAAAGALAARGDVTIGLHFTVAAWCAVAATFVGLWRYIDERVPAVTGSLAAPPDVRAASPVPGSRESVGQRVPRQMQHQQAARPLVPGERVGPRNTVELVGPRKTDEQRTAQPPTVQPQTGQPQTGQPQTGQPRTGQPRTGQPRTGQPQTGQPRTGQPQIGQPQIGQAAAAERRGGRGRLIGNRSLLLIGLLTLCATVIEGAADDWLALYLHTGRGLSEASAALGYTAFATAMTVVRFAGTPAAEWLGRAGAVRAGGVLGVAGVLITVLSPWVPVTFAGALLWGAGVCLVFPAAVSAAGETDRPAESIALVTSIGYGSILIGPPLIGALADVTGMGAALLTLAALAAGVAALAPAVRPSPKPTTLAPNRDADAVQDAGSAADQDASSGAGSGASSGADAGRDAALGAAAADGIPDRDQFGSASIAR